jgi:predicted O-methyltransferase YrrM
MNATASGPQRSVPVSLGHRAVRTARSLRAVITSPPYATPGHFYSPLTTNADRGRALTWTDAPGVDLAEERQLALARQLQPMLAQPLPGPRYEPANIMYGPADAAVYRAMLTQLLPARVLEVGSGYSTAVALDEADVNPALSDLKITCIEPFPSRLLRLLTSSDRGRLSLLREPVQDVALDTFAELAPGDVLFIDSTHVVKAGSDVIWLLLHVLPRLAGGVIVHVHDIFWPFEYPAQWLRQGRDWTEAYLLHAFLAGNAGWEILFFSSWFWQRRPDLVPPHLASDKPGAIWIRKLP